MKSTLDCAVCGDPVMSLHVAPPGEPLVDRPEPGVPLPLDEWRLDATVHGIGGANQTLGPDTAEQVQAALNGGDVRYLRCFEYPIAAGICQTCNAAYCTRHMRIEIKTEPGGIPTFDDYFVQTCPEGHGGTFETF